MTPALASSPALHAPPQFLTPLVPCNLPVSRCAVSRESASRRILLMRLGGYGDILMGTPLLAALREAYPDAHLTWMAGHSEAQAIDANPYLDEVILWDAPYFRSAWRHARYAAAIRRFLAFRRALRSRRYDAFVSLQPEEWPLLTLVSGAAQTIGVFDTFTRHWGEEHHPHYRRFYKDVYSRPELHRIDQYLAVLEAFRLPEPAAPRLSMGFTSEDEAAAAAFLEERGVGPQDTVAALAPLTTWVTKNWPAERYAALGDRLAKDCGCRVVLLGGSGDQETLTQIASQMSAPAVVSAGTLTFREAAALIHRSHLLVSGDTGPMHVAAAVGTPQVALFGATSPLWYGPRVPHALPLLHPVPCGPCDKLSCSQTGNDYLRCLTLITVDEAQAAAGRLLGGLKVRDLR